ncbi:MFS transporter [Pseudomonas hefeiensis]|uniref:MFS transporter n=1 Tax=Pseudomonas hefeiensis TaxID=2738125 RepID=A0ABY9G721_9PSED|nr:MULTISPECIES: MFS transporter [unclassified Pseudomonas]WLH11396.1 MFS transporter [Pseudomonas sp. FP205]WLH94463.1 MFS transporter [Pseudomonas sp. FP53]WLI38744.1 MFS transporter [Pseudomonas sp. FP821]
MDTMTENDYLIAWGLYAFAALGCLLVWMRMTRWIWRWLREPLRLLMAVLLFSPTIVDPVKEQVAPALAIVALDVLFKVGNNAWRAVSDLFMYGMIAFGLYLIVVLIRFPIERAASARKEKTAAAKAAAAADELQDEQQDEQPFGVAGDDRYGRPPVPSNPQRSRIEPRL